MLHVCSVVLVNNNIENNSKLTAILICFRPWGSSRLKFKLGVFTLSGYTGRSILFDT